MNGERGSKERRKKIGVATDLPGDQRKAEAYMQDVLHTIDRIASSDLSVVIVGEHGTGKEWTARRIHERSRRASGPFHVVDCEALSADQMEVELFGLESLSPTGVELRKGAFEISERGTLLLDEVEALEHPVQIRVARAIEMGKIRRVNSDDSLSTDVRVITTMTRPPEQLIASHALREELFYRISPVVVTLPPLRERREEIPTLVREFLVGMQAANGISEEAIRLCVHYDWPGNIRHLHNAIEYASLMSGGSLILPRHLPDYLQK
jgi:DNA-binding NtrC family response regulator